MARPLRIQYPGAVYHVTCRGNEKKAIFRDDADRRRFLRILQQSLTTYTVTLYSYVLMTNHFHLLLETPRGNLGEFMRAFNITYTGYFNRRHHRIGHLYQGRYKSLLVEKGVYLAVLSRYIHLNPVRLKSMETLPIQDKLRHLLHYPWSSLAGYLHQSNTPTFLDYRTVLSEYGTDTDKARNAYREALVGDLGQGKDLKESIIGQSLMGGEAFIGWVKQTFTAGAGDRETPGYRALRRHRADGEILTAIEHETGKDVDALKSEKGTRRRIAMELLYRAGGLTGPEIGAIFGVDYSTVSQERKRLRAETAKDSSLQQVMERIEQRMSIQKI